MGKELLIVVIQFSLVQNVSISTFTERERERERETNPHLGKELLVVVNYPVSQHTQQNTLFVREHILLQEDTFYCITQPRVRTL